MARRVVNIPTPSLGLDTKNDTDTIGDTNTPYCLNTDFDQPGLVVQRAGTQKVGAEISVSNAGKGLFPFIKDASTSFLVSKFGGTYYQRSATDGDDTAIGTGFSAGLACFAQFNGNLYAATYTDVVQVWDGVAPAFTSAGLAHNFRYIFVFGGRFWGVGDNFPNRVRFSAVGAMTFATNDYIEFESDGFVVTALKDNNGVFEIHRGDAGTWTVSPTVSGTPLFLVEKTTVLRGSYTQFSATKVENSCVYLAPDGVRSSGQLQYYPAGLYGTVISDLIDPTFKGLQSSKNALAYATYFSRKLYMAVPFYSNNYNDAILTNYNGVWSIYTNVFAAQLAEWKGKLYFTDSRKGQLWRFEPTLRSDDGQAIPFVYQTKYFHLKRPHLIKFLERMIFRLKSDQATTIRISVSFDFGPFTTVFDLATPVIFNTGVPPLELGDRNLFPGSHVAAPGGVIEGNQAELTFYERQWPYAKNFYFIAFRIEHLNPNKTVKMKDFDVVFEDGSAENKYDIN